MRTIPGLVVLIALSACGSVQKQHQQIQREGESLRGELAELYVAKGAKEAAVPLLQRIISEHPDDARARVLYGCVLRDSSLYPQAETQFKAALILDGKRPDAHAGYAILLDLTDRHLLALTHHQEATKLAPGMADYRNNLGFSLLSAGDPVAAIPHLEKALALDPGLGQAYVNLGFAYGRADRMADAERTFKAGLGEAAALLDLAIIHDERGETERARELRQRAYALSPELRPTVTFKESP